MNSDVERLFVDDMASALVAAETRVKSLEEDVRTLKELLSLALEELRSERELNTRLMFRLKRGNGRD